MLINFLPRKDLQARLAKVEEYSKTLGSSAKVNDEQTIGCHLAKLVLEKDREVRVRSMQTIVELDARAVLPPAIKEMVLVSKNWPDPRQTELACILASVLQKCGSMPMI